MFRNSAKSAATFSFIGSAGGGKEGGGGSRSGGSVFQFRKSSSSLPFSGTNVSSLGGVFKKFSPEGMSKTMSYASSMEAAAAEQEEQLLYDANIPPLSPPPASSSESSEDTKSSRRGGHHTKNQERRRPSSPHTLQITPAEAQAFFLYHSGRSATAVNVTQGGTIHENLPAFISTNSLKTLYHHDDKEHQQQEQNYRSVFYDSEAAAQLRWRTKVAEFHLAQQNQRTESAHRKWMQQRNGTSLLGRIKRKFLFHRQTSRSSTPLQAGTSGSDASRRGRGRLAVEDLKSFYRALFAAFVLGASFIIVPLAVAALHFLTVFALVDLVYRAKETVAGMTTTVVET